MPFSGIQILDFGFNDADLSSKRKYLEKTIDVQGDQAKRMLIPLPDNIDEAAQIEASKADTDLDPYTIFEACALAPFCGLWVLVPVLRIKRNSGTKEIPQSTRAHLYIAVRNHPTAKELMVEARPELVTDAMLTEARAHLGDKTLKVAIGLESMDEHVRNDILKKFIGQDSFLRALERLQNNDVKSFVYVFLGAPGLSEAQAYSDARASIKALSTLGVDEIALSCAFIPPGGQLEALYDAGDYRPPWLWTVGKLIEDAIAHNWPLCVGGFDDFPPPVAIAQNCGACDGKILAAIDGYRQTGQYNTTVQCSCKDTWQATVII